MAKGKQKGFVNFKQIFQLAKQNYFVTAMVLCVLFVGVVGVYKLFIAKPTYVYVKVKVGQGLWWVNSAKPNIWLINAIKNGDMEKSLTGKPIVEVLDIRYYSWWTSGQYDLYLTLKLEVGSNKKTKTYTFKRSTIGIGSPIDLEFPTTQFSGTIIELGIKPFIETYVTKTITLTKKSAFPWEYDAIRIGDTYFDGNQTVFKILDKRSLDTEALTSDVYGNYPSYPLAQKYIEVKAQIRVQQKNNQFIYGSEQVLIPNRTINITTANFSFQDYALGTIE